MIFTQDGAEVRMASNQDFILFQWIAGLSSYKYKNNNESTNRSYVDGSGDLADQISYVRQTNKAAFANITYPLWFYDKFSLTLGYRQSWDKTSHFDAGRGGTPEEMEYDGQPDYKFGFQWDASDNMMIYGNYASSYRVDAMGTFGLWDSKAKEFNPSKTRPPEENSSYTLGMKSRLFDNSVQLNVAGYYYDYRNSFANDNMLRASMTHDQFDAAGIAKGMTQAELDNLWAEGTGNKAGPGFLIEEVQLNGVGTGTYNINEQNFHTWGDMRTIGLDASISWVVSEKDMVNLSASCLDSKWSKLTFDYMFSNIWTPKNCDGITSPNSPKLSITAGYEHNFDLGDYGMLIPHIDIQYKSHYNLVYNTSQTVMVGNAQVADPGYFYQESYTTYNATLAFQPTDTIWGLTWNVNAYVKNITNYAVKKSYNSMGTPTLMIGDPRVYAATLSIKY